ncbi:MAG: hypothetical protein ABR978_00195 [Dehalococcoidia bacterium]|jgi:hypothetical protein
MRMKEQDPRHVHGLAGVRVRAAVAFVVGCAMIAGMMLSSTSGQAAELHGISFLKGCNSPTVVGQPYICTFQAQNTVDTAHDTLTITSVVDIVHAFAGDVTSTNLLPTPTTLTLGGGATCNVGQTLCTLPFGASVSLTISYYNVAPGDPNPLTDTATLTWQDTCDQSPQPSNCPLGQTLHTQAGSQSEVQTPTPTPTNTPTATPTATPTKPVGVGGSVKLPPAAITDESGASGSGWPVAAYLALAGGAAGAILAISVGGWYARRRWLV